MEVQNAIAPEEKTLLSQIQALIEQLLSSGSGGEQQQMVAESENPNMQDPNQAVDPEPEDVKKEMQEETGDTKAEDRLNNQTDLTDSSMAQLGKSLLAVLAKQKIVQKSTSNPNSAILNELKKLNGTLSSVVKAQQDQDVFNQGIMDALGFSKEVVQKSITNTTPPQTQKPIQSQDMTTFAKELVAEVMKSMNQQPTRNPEFQHPFNQNKRTVVEKDMANVIDFIGTHGRNRRAM